MMPFAHQGPRAGDPITVFIHSHNRPLYLWASLDSLFRNTIHPHRFVFIDLASNDPMVRQVVAGFERRGMFAEVLWSPTNHADNLWELLWPRLENAGPFFAYCQTDVVIEPANVCWLTAFTTLMERAPRLAMLGSIIDKRDFISLDEARRVDPQCEEQRLMQMIKWSSPERHQDPSAVEGPIFSPHNPAGRLLMMRTSALREIGAGDDASLHTKFLAAGYETGVATAVRHRHLSLLHLYDYPEYDYARRNAYCEDLTPKAAP